MSWERRVVDKYNSEQCHTVGDVLEWASVKAEEVCREVAEAHKDGRSGWREHVIVAGKCAAARILNDWPLPRDWRIDKNTAEAAPPDGYGPQAAACEAEHDARFEAGIAFALEQLAEWAGATPEAAQEAMKRRTPTVAGDMREAIARIASLRRSGDTRESGNGEWLAPAEPTDAMYVKYAKAVEKTGLASALSLGAVWYVMRETYRGQRRP